MKTPEDYGITRYNKEKFKKTGILDCFQDVDISGKELKAIPFQFGEVAGHFDCSDNQLASLKGCPSKAQDFYCFLNKLTSLKYCPSEAAAFDCSNNLLTSLRYSPEIVRTSFYCNNNKLKSLKYSPSYVGTAFHCYNNRLTSLKGCPRYIQTTFDCSNNKLRSLKGAPIRINSHKSHTRSFVFKCNKNQLTSLKYIPKIKYGSIDVSKNKLLSLEHLPKVIYGQLCCKENKRLSFKNSPFFVLGSLSHDAIQHKTDLSTLLIAGITLVNLDIKTWQDLKKENVFGLQKIKTWEELDTKQWIELMKKCPDNEFYHLCECIPNNKSYNETLKALEDKLEIINFINPSQSDAS